MKVEPIVRLFTGQYIDLSKIVSISEAYFIDRMGSGGYFVGFDIHCQLLEKPIRYEQKFDYGDYSVREGRTVKMVGGHFRDARDFGGWGGSNDKNIAAVHKLQKEIDVILEQWRQFKAEE